MKKLVSFAVLVVAMSTFSTILGCSTEQQNLNHYNNDILGLSFDYPAYWGEADTTDDGISLTINFTGQKDLVFSTKYSFEQMTAKARCEEDWNKAGHYDMQQENGEDIYAYDGSVRIGDCESKSPYLNVASAVRTDSDNLWVSIDEDLEGTTEMALVRTYYFDLQSPLLNELTISATVPSIESSGVCLKRSTSGCETVLDPEPDKSCPLEQNLRCINYAERQMILDAFTDFEDSDFGAEVDAVLDSIVILQAENAETIFTENYKEPYKELTQYSNDDLGISFTYPVIFGEVSSDSNALDMDGFSIAFYTLEDAIASEEAFYAKNDGGPTCVSNVLTELEWQKAYEAFFSNIGPDETINGYNVLNLGPNRVLIGVDGKCGDSLTEAKYILFDNDRMVKIYGDTVQNAEDYSWLTPLQVINYQLRAETIEAILASIKFLD